MKTPNPSSSPAHASACQNWKSLAGKAVGSVAAAAGMAGWEKKCHHFIKREMKPEWKNFTPEMRAVLFHLLDPMVDDEAALRDKEEIIGYFKEDIRFIIECLLVCLGKPVFMCVYEMAEEALATSVKDEKPSEASRAWQEIFPRIFAKAIERESVKELRTLLELAHDSQPPKLRPASGFIHSNTPPLNDTSLMKACETDNFELVRLFLVRGYRLRLEAYSNSDEGTASSSSGKKKKKKPKRTLPEKGADCVFHRSSLSARQRRREDDVRNLYILRQMAKPAYILGCYVVVCEEKYEQSRAEKNEPICECGNRGASLSSRSTKDPEKGKTGIGLYDLLSYETSAETFHFCPDNDKFEPSPDCRRHLECNDPIYRSFDLARFASRTSKRRPEFRSEYMEVAAACRQLSVDLLRQCRTGEDVREVLREKSASVKYFGGARTPFMDYPRARLAIEHSHKEFVSHVYCQSLFREEFNGHVDWQGSSFLYKTAYSLMQTLFTIFHIFNAMFVMTGRSFTVLGRRQVPEVKYGRSRMQRLWFRYLHFCNDAVINLDAPINKFISALGYYVVYLLLVMLTIMRPLSHEVSEQDEFTWYHKLLLLYSGSMLLQDAYFFSILRSISHYFNYWRFFELLHHVTMFSSLITRLLMTKLYPCQQQYQHSLYVCDEDTVLARESLSTLYTLLFAFAASSAIMRLLYFAQMHDRIGPVIINLSRVMLDIFAMLVAYVVMVVAFAAAFVYMQSAEMYVVEEDAQNMTDIMEDHNSTSSSLTNFEEFTQSFVEMVDTLFWSILNPGPTDVFMDRDDALGFATSLMFASFQVLAVIVFLNLLIAVMNSTVQKVETQRQLYWKFTRTSIWMDYFEPSSVITPPFTFLLPVWYVFLRILYIIRTMRRWWKAIVIIQDFSVSNHTGCNEDRFAFDARRRHARLLYELIERYLKSRRRQARLEDEVRKEDLDRLRRDIVDEILGHLRKQEEKQEQKLMQQREKQQ